MSYIKRQYEFLADKVTNAIYEECFDMPDYLDSTKAEVYDSVWTAIIDGDLTPVIDFMVDRSDSSDNPIEDYPLTTEALGIIGQAMEWRLI